ncbi:MAG: hypothetical protein PVF27_09655, partial [Gemmatimonadales bacterium]
NDVESAGGRGFLFAAVLTPKGMIISDLFVARRRTGFTLYVPREGKTALFGVFARSLPPRLAKATDVSTDHAVLRLVGPASHDVAQRAGLGVPDAGHAGPATLGGTDCLLARPSLDRPFSLQVSCPSKRVDAVREALVAAGAVAGDTRALELRRIVDGWPRLGAEIGAKTLPQEANFDEIEGVSYTKGCYTGQETVARVHFRGRTNRWLAGLVWHTAPDPAKPRAMKEDKPVGRVTSVAWLNPLERWIGLALLRREMNAGQHVHAGGAPARVIQLPFDNESVGL